jgi:hypothetical protein
MRLHRLTQSELLNNAAQAVRQHKRPEWNNQGQRLLRDIMGFARNYCSLQYAFCGG